MTGVVDRLVDWPTRLVAFFDERRSRPFVYGDNDCCLFAADAVLAITGVDPAAAFRGTYSTEAGAAGAVAHAGGFEALAATVAAAAGCSPVPKFFAQRGDVAVGFLQTGPQCLLVRTDTAWAGPGATGMVINGGWPVTTVYRVG